MAATLLLQTALAYRPCAADTQERDFFALNVRSRFSFARSLSESSIHIKKKNSSFGNITLASATSTLTSFHHLLRPHFPLALGAVASLLWGGATCAFAQESFTYTNIVDSSGALKSFDFLLPSINNQGTVVFHATFEAADGAPAGEGIYASDEGSYRGIAVSGEVYSGFFANPAINDDGLVAFTAVLADGLSEGVFVGDGQTVGNTTIASSASGRLYQFSLPIHFDNYGPAIDRNGNVVFRAQFQTTRQPALFVGDGSEEETQLFGPTGDAIACNANGDVVFLSDSGDGAQQILRTTVAGGTPVAIATTAGNSLFGSFDTGAISINNAGIVAFVAQLKAGGYGVFTSTGADESTTIIDTNMDSQFSSFHSVSLNDTGAVAVVGTLAAGGTNIFVFDASGGKNVVPFTLFGSSLTSFSGDIGPRALNDLGQVVFSYGLEDGRTGLAVATPSSGGGVAPKTLVNISTRLPVGTGANVVIGGFIVSGPESKNVIVRAIGPSLAAFGVTGALADPTLELHAGDGSLIAANDNWKDSQEADINATGLAPGNDLESVILRTLAPGSYTAIVQGKNDTTGVGLVEAYDLTQSPDSKLANISTRGLVGVGDEVLIGGFIAGPDTQVVVRAIGPSLGAFGVDGALQDPTLELHDGDGAIVASNDNWKDSDETAIEATGLAPADDRESAILRTLATGSYTAIVRGTNETVGVGLVEVYNLP